MLTLPGIASAVSATKGAIEIFDKVAGQIKTVLTKLPILFLRFHHSCPL